jgi:hypothetical protein
MTHSDPTTGAGKIQQLCRSAHRSDLSTHGLFPALWPPTRSPNVVIAPRRREESPTWVRDIPQPGAIDLKKARLIAPAVLARKPPWAFVIRDL